MFSTKVAFVALAATTSLALALTVYVLLEERRARKEEGAEPGLSAAEEQLAKKDRKRDNDRLQSAVERALAAGVHRLSADGSVALIQESLAKICDVDQSEVSEQINKLGFPGLGEVERMDLRALKKVGILGSGGFGLVVLVEAAGTGTKYAVKVVDKRYAEKFEVVRCLLSERFLLVLTRSPFVVDYYCAFHTEHDVVFCMEPLLGGEVYRTYSQKGLFGSVELARFACASVALAMEHLHRLHVVRRDAKPEDMCFDHRGYVKIVDLGLAKLIVSKTYTTCGTPDYFAPEVIKSIGHDWAVDAWCLGILLFELLAGKPPFESAYPMQIYSKIIKGIEAVAFPLAVKEAEPLVRAMLVANPNKRLPRLEGAWTNVHSHPYFRTFDWSALARGAMPAPYVPEVDWLSNFKQPVRDESPVVSEVKAPTFPYAAHFGEVVDFVSIRD